MSASFQKPALSVCEYHCRNIKLWSSTQQSIKLRYSHESWTGVCFAHCADCCHCTTQFLIQIILSQKKLNSSFNNYSGLLAAHYMIKKHYVINDQYIFNKVFMSLCWLLNDTKHSNDSETQIFWTTSSILFRLISAMKPVQFQWILNSKILSQRVFDLCNLLDYMLDEYVSIHDQRHLIGICVLYLIKKMRKYKKKKKITFDIKCNKNIKKQYNDWMSLKVHLFDGSGLPLTLDGCLDATDTKQQINLNKQRFNIQDQWLIECGNSKCNKDYLLDKYGLICKETFMNHDLWKNRKIINKWFLCSGCKVTNYCSKQCQKRAWNKENHKLQCNPLMFHNKQNND